MFLTSCFTKGAISDTSQGHVAFRYTTAMELRTSAKNFYESLLQADNSRDFILPLT